MSNAILDAIANEQRKLERQNANHAATVEVASVLGMDAKTERKLERQKRDIATTKANIKKLNDAAGKLPK